MRRVFCALLVGFFAVSTTFAKESRARSKSVPVSNASPSNAGTPAVQIAGSISDEDYPKEAMAAEESGTVTVRYLISKDGGVTSCEIETSSGSKSLDTTSCAIVIGRFKFKPALDLKKQPQTDQRTQRITWRLPIGMNCKPFDGQFLHCTGQMRGPPQNLDPATGFPRETAKPPQKISGEFLPDDYPAESLRKEEEGLVFADLAVGENGKIVYCRAEKEEFSLELLTQTCKVFIDRFVYEPGLDAQGRPTISPVTRKVTWVIPDALVKLELPIRIVSDANAFQASLVFDVNERGTIANCRPVVVGGNAVTVKAYGVDICEAFSREKKYPIKRDRAGKTLIYPSKAQISVAKAAEGQ